MKKIIINADDFGYRTQINKAIIYAYKNGIVRSTSMLVNRDAFDEAVLLAKAEVNWFTFASEETPSYYGMLLEQTAEGWGFAEPKTWAPQVKSQYIFDNREVEGAPHYKLIPVKREIPDYVKNRTIPTDVLIKK